MNVRNRTRIAFIACMLFVGVGLFVISSAVDALQTKSISQQTEWDEVTPKKVRNVRAHKRFKKKVVIRWKAKPEIDMYQVVVLRNGKRVKNIHVRKQPKDGKKYIQHTVKKLKPGTQYTIRIRAKRKEAQPKFGHYSKRLRVWTKGQRPAPAVSEEDAQEPENSNEEVGEEEEEENSNEESEEVVEETPEETPEETTENESEEEEVEEAEPVLFGFWGLNGFISEEGLAQVQDDYNSTVFQVASAGPGYTVGTLLPLIKDAGMKVTLRMTPGPDYSADFDLDAWKDHIDTWAESGVQEYIDNGTLVGHMLLDDILNFSYISDSTDPTGDELDEMARYSEEAFPGLLTFVREQASDIPVPTSGEFEYLDAVVNQYKAAEGDVEEYVSRESAAAASLQVRSIYGMNIVDGGDGSSGQVGIRDGKYAMTASELTSYGEVLLDAADIPLFLMWEYDGEDTWIDGTIGSDYFSQSALKAVLAGLGTRAAGE